MSNLVRMGQGRNELAAVSQGLTEQLSRMETGAEVIKYAMSIMSEIYVKAEHDTLIALGITEQLRDSGTPIKLTPEQNAAFQALRHGYIETMAAAAQFGGMRVMRQGADAPLESQNAIDRLLGVVGE